MKNEKTNKNKPRQPRFGCFIGEADKQERGREVQREVERERSREREREFANQGSPSVPADIRAS